MRRLLVAVMLAAALTGCTLSSGNQQPTPDLPRVYFVSPANNARVIEGSDLTIDLYAEDDTVGIARIELRLNSTMLSDAAPANFQTERRFRVEMNWVANGIGSHVLSAIAYRPDGTPSDETFITVDVVSE
ncbi:MAG: Ig-like domain-containing protein [Chloroflexota bacterium]